jgi:benzoylformate decarboxylase
MSSSTVRSVTYDLLRTLEMTTIFGNPGSTEEPFLADFPDDFSYVEGLQEATVIGMADAFAQTTRRPALVNVHSCAGLGNAMGNIIAAHKASTPLIITSGQQHREMIIGDPYLNNTDATLLPKPWVKWSYQTTHPEEVPDAFMRAYAMALEPPAGPVYLSIPLDDWYKPMNGPVRVRTVADRVAPDEHRIRTFAHRISASSRPALIFGPDVDRSGGWDSAVALAEKLRAAVYQAPLLDRASFPENHPLFVGPLGNSIKGISDSMAGHDVVVMIGGEVFRYYPYVAGDYLPEGTQLLQITASPETAGAARMGDSLISDSKIAIDRLIELVDDGSARTAPKTFVRTRQLPDTASHPATPAEVYAALSRVKPADAVIVSESTSTMEWQLEWLPTVKPDSWFFSPSGGLGWGLPASVGVALGDRERGVSRPVIGLIGDGSVQYSIQAFWTAAQHKLPIVYVVMRNNEYSVLKAFARLEETPGVPGLDLPGLDIATVARGFGCNAVDVDAVEDLEKEFTQGLAADGPTVIVIPTKPVNAALG